MLLLPQIKTRVYSILEKQGVLLAGILIFAYYLWAAIDLFGNANPQRGFQGYFFQFSSVVLLWGLVYLGSKLFDYKKKQQEEQQNNARLIQEYERRKMQLDMLDEVTHSMNDAINNPLSTITISSSSIRKRFSPDTEILAYLDSIDGALKRLREVLSDFQSHQTKKIVRSLKNLPSQQEPLQP